MVKPRSPRRLCGTSASRPQTAPKRLQNHRASEQERLGKGRAKRGGRGKCRKWGILQNRFRSGREKRHIPPSIPPSIHASRPPSPSHPTPGTYRGGRTAPPAPSPPLGSAPPLPAGGGTGPLRPGPAGGAARRGGAVQPEARGGTSRPLPAPRPVGNTTAHPLLKLFFPFFLQLPLFCPFKKNYLCQLTSCRRFLSSTGTPYSCKSAALS